jgi:hypothetical protein
MTLRLNDISKSSCGWKAALLAVLLAPCTAQLASAQSLASFAGAAGATPQTHRAETSTKALTRADLLAASFTPHLLDAQQEPVQPAAPAQQPSAKPAGQQTSLPDAPKPVLAGQKTDCFDDPCPREANNWYERFVNGPHAKALTPRQKAWLAVRNLLDPFNAVTILGEAGISVAADSHSDYGPGFRGFGKYVGVSYTEDLTGEFFNTFLIPSIVHQDPRYHRMPHASYPRRITHAITQVIWTQSDSGKGMLNYANLVGFAIDDEIANLYVPGRDTNASATAQRYAIGIATAPISNFISEFLPDVARHIHVQEVVVQRIINQVARNDSSSF